MYCSNHCCNPSALKYILMFGTVCVMSRLFASEGMGGNPRWNPWLGQSIGACSPLPSRTSQRTFPSPLEPEDHFEVFVQSSPSGVWTSPFPSLPSRSTAHLAPWRQPTTKRRRQRKGPPRQLPQRRHHAHKQAHRRRCTRSSAKTPRSCVHLSPSKVRSNLWWARARSHSRFGGGATQTHAHSLRDRQTDTKEGRNTSHAHTLCLSVSLFVCVVCVCF